MRRHRLQATSRAVWAISIVALCLTVLLGGTARAGSSNEPDVFVRAVDATDPASVATGFVSTTGDVSSTTLTLFAQVSTYATIAVIGGLTAGVLYLAWRVGDAG